MADLHYCTNYVTSSESVPDSVTQNKEIKTHIYRSRFCHTHASAQNPN